MTFGDLNRETEYLRFVEEPNPGRKTCKWRVESKSSGDILGRIAWWGAWRQFVFAPHIDTVFNKGCLNDISAFLNDALVMWRAAKANVDVAQTIIDIALANEDPDVPYDEGSALAEAVKIAGTNCCCHYGIAVAGEYPEFGCAKCERHQAGLGEQPHELCKRHAREAGIQPWLYVLQHPNGESDTIIMRDPIKDQGGYY